MPLTRVRFEPVRSAEPPISSGVAGTSASSAFWLDCRVASFGLVSAISCFSAATASCQLSGSLPAITRSNSARWLRGRGASARRGARRRRGCRPRASAPAGRRAR